MKMLGISIFRPKFYLPHAFLRNFANYTILAKLELSFSWIFFYVRSKKILHNPFSFLKKLRNKVRTSKISVW